MTAERETNYLEIQYPQLEGLRHLLTTTLVDENGNPIPGAVEAGFTPIAEGVVYYISQRPLRTGLPGFAIIQDLEWATGGPNVGADLNYYAHTTFDQESGRATIWYSRRLLSSLVAQRQGREEIDPTLLSLREVTLHEMHHIGQMESDSRQLLNDLQLKSVGGISAWIKTPSEVEAVRGAREMEQRIASALLT